MTCSIASLSRPAAILVLVLLGVLVGGCSAAPSSDAIPAAASTPVSQSADPSPVVSFAAAPADVRLDPEEPPKPLPGDCGTYLTTLERAPTTIEMDVKTADAVILGRVTAIGAAQWNTTDGLPPARPDIEASRVMRLIHVEPETTITGKAEGLLTLWIQGGTIGCVQFLTSAVPDEINIGDRFAFFIGSQAPRNGLDVAQRVAQLWRIEGDHVISPVEGAVPLSAFQERASAAVPSD